MLPSSTPLSPEEAERLSWLEPGLQPEAQALLCPAMHGCLPNSSSCFTLPCLCAMCKALPGGSRY